ncbi:MAG: FAD-binding protein, partial [Candidatus Bathyarchaeia archaeon]
MSYEKDFVLSKFQWPYPLRYGVVNNVGCDVLVIGGGVAGCWAAIKAAERGAKVVIAEKGCTIKSGAGGMGCDHWGRVPKPIGRLTAEELAGPPSFGKSMAD